MTANPGPVSAGDEVFEDASDDEEDVSEDTGLPPPPSPPPLDLQ
jgi:hypothetical protein